MTTMTLTDVLALASRGVMRNVRRTLLTGAMVTLGIVAVIFARGYISGLQVMMSDALVEVRYGALQVSQGGYHDSAELSPLDLDLPEAGPVPEAIARTPGVDAVAGRLQFVGMIVKGDTSLVFSGLGLDPVNERRVCPRGPASTRPANATERAGKYQLLAGPGLGAPNGVVLGRELAEALEAKVGDTLTLLVQTRAQSMDAADVEVVGIYGYDQPEDNRRGVIAPLALAQRVTHMQGRVTAFALRVEDRAQVRHVAAELRRTLAGTSAEVLSWEVLGPYIVDVMRLQDRVLGLVMGVIFVLLLTGIANTMLMSVFERTREVGTLMSLGLPRHRIVTLFIVEALLLTTVAALFGVGGGIAVTRVAHAVGLPFYIPAVGRIWVRPLVDPRYVALAVGAALLAALLAALYPAWRASRMNPVTALRAT